MWVIFAIVPLGIEYFIYFLCIRNIIVAYAVFQVGLMLLGDKKELGFGWVIVVWRSLVQEVVLAPYSE